LSYKIAVIGDMDTTIGFALAGVTYVHVHRDIETTISKFKEFISKDVALIIITYAVAEEIGDELDRALRGKKLLPVVLKIPDKTGYRPPVDEFVRMMRRAIGAEIVIREEAG
jgi:V/A-type H+-transporting ATPase subunit F